MRRGWEGGALASQVADDHFRIDIEEEQPVFGAGHDEVVGVELKRPRKFRV